MVTQFSVSVEELELSYLIWVYSKQQGFLILKAF